MSELVVGKTSLKDFEDLRYTAKKAVETTNFWKEKFSRIDIENLTPETLVSKLDSLYITPKDLYNTEKVWPSYIKNCDIFYTIVRTSGTTGQPKRIPYTLDDKKRVARQFIPWVNKYLEKGDKIASFFPPLPSASGIMGYGGLEELGVKAVYYQVPIQFIRMPDILISELRHIRPTVLFSLTTTAFLLGLKLPDDIKEDLRVILVGGETLTEELAKATLENFPNAIIIDTFGTSEDGAVGYRVITKTKTTKFSFPESIITLKSIEDEEYKEYHKVYITKVMKEGELTGLPLFNYDIGDLARVEDGEIRSIIRVKDAISLAGATLYLDQIISIVHRYPFLVDFVILYYPLSPSNPKPKAIIRVGYIGEKPAGIEDEIRSLIYEGNNPVRYEVEESKQAELIIEAVPAEKVREGLPQKPGKTKRIFIVGKDI
ncbi:long-chain fatty acid--CoA ligase [Thermococcus sp. M39]|uniref:AMP-binding protein n=1 Tax=unclassified Thermococcus TaxID=2627626 RepID=UPI001439C61A|nr:MULTISPECIES: AMP-binding protein [unclassified Thermococcus]NJE09089.1 long-chain fatty acid--CoA ligase [Thermococcus sp. M39]NJE12038.1 long-chain fatty acid--CoA ligase [Thermococcus sp. LS2]